MYTVDHVRISHLPLLASSLCFIYQKDNTSQHHNYPINNSGIKTSPLPRKEYGTKLDKKYLRNRYHVNTNDKLTCRSTSTMPSEV